MRTFFCIPALFIAFTTASQSRAPGSFLLGQYAMDEAMISIPVNPATLGTVSSFSFIVHAESPFMLMPGVSLSAIIPTGTGAFNGSVSYRGSSLHNETSVRAGYGRKLAENIFTGVAFGYNHTGIPGYVRKAEGDVSVGVLFRLSGELVTGIDIRKQVRFASGDKLSNGVYHAGLGYTLSGVLLIGAEVEKEDDRPAYFRAALEYRFHPDLFTFIGFATGTGTSFFGSRIHLSYYHVEARFSRHPLLGWSPSITISFQKKNKTNEQAR